MFKYCQNLSNLDLTTFNTKNVTNMSYIFYYCRGLDKVRPHFNDANYYFFDNISGGERSG